MIFLDLYSADSTVVLLWVDIVFNNSSRAFGFVGAHVGANIACKSEYVFDFIAIIGIVMNIH